MHVLLIELVDLCVFISLSLSFIEVNTKHEGEDLLFTFFSSDLFTRKISQILTMTDQIDDDIIEIKRPTTTSSASSITTSSRRPMYIETEVRTDTITRRRAGSNTHNRSVYEVLQNTKSPTE